MSATSDPGDKHLGLRFTVKLTTADLFWVFFERSWLRASMLVMLAVVVFSTVLHVVVSGIEGPLWRDVVSYWTNVGRLTVLAVLTPLTGMLFAAIYYWTAKRTLATSRVLAGSVEFQVDAGGVVVRYAMGEERMSWSVFYRAEETRQAFVLFQAANTMLIWPKNAIAEVTPIKTFRETFWVGLPRPPG